VSVERIVGELARTSFRLAAAACLGCFAVICYAVALRYFFGRPQPWADEVVAWLMVATVMLAMPEAQRRGEHVAVDSLVERLGRRGRAALAVFGLAAVAASAAILVYEGSAMVAFSRLVGMASNISAVPLWWVQALVPVGFALLLIVAAMQLARLAQGKPTAEAEEETLKAGPLE
jgi:TRAP-type C4-dicarboxylate transport system permease small subunit